MKPDIYIKVRFKTSEEGGRKTSVKRSMSLPKGWPIYTAYW